MEKLTKQGVRNLDHLKGRSKGRRLPMPPTPSIGCRHSETYEEVDQICGMYVVRCVSCHAALGERW